MRTFGEALSAVDARDPDVLLRDMKDGADDLRGSPRLASLLRKLAIGTVRSVAEHASEPDEPLLSIMTHLSYAFRVGVLVGMEMEKEGNKNGPA